MNLPFTFETLNLSKFLGAGPAPRNLDRFNVANVNGRLVIDTGTIIESPRAPGMSVKYPQGLSCIALTTEE